MRQRHRDARPAHHEEHGGKHMQRNDVPVGAFEENTFGVGCVLGRGRACSETGCEARVRSYQEGEGLRSGGGCVGCGLGEEGV